MLFVAKHSIIPVPRVHCTFTHHGLTYIVMERLPGTNLGQHWARRDTTSRIGVLDQLRMIMRELRSLKRGTTENSVAGIDGGPLFHQSLPGNNGSLGPFQTAQGFHRYLRNGISSDPSLPRDIRKLVSMNEDTVEETCLTHGDLSSLNVLAVGDRVTGLVDWENAAWLPTYWEYVASWHVNPQNMFWQEEVSNFLDVFPRELEMEKLRRKYFGDY